MNTARRISAGLGAAAMMITLSPAAHAASVKEEPITVVKYQAAADYFGCRYYPNVFCGKRG